MTEKRKLVRKVYKPLYAPPLVSVQPLLGSSLDPYMKHRKILDGEVHEVEPESEEDRRRLENEFRLYYGDYWLQQPQRKKDNV